MDFPSDLPTPPTPPNNPPPTADQGQGVAISCDAEQCLFNEAGRCRAADIQVSFSGGAATCETYEPLDGEGEGMGEGPGMGAPMPPPPGMRGGGPMREPAPAPMGRRVPPPPGFGGM
jgi:hypothetical protein